MSSIRQHSRGDMLRVVVVSASLGIAGAAVAADIEVVIKEGDPAPGTPGLLIAGLNAPFTAGNGKLGFTGSVTGDNFVWFDDEVIWLNSDGLPTVLTGGESTMGISNTGGFIYSPSADGNDAVWTEAGLLAREDDPAPGFPDQFLSFCSRPQMIADGTSHFVAGITDTVGGSTQARALYRGSGGVLTKLLASGDPVGDFTIDFPAGVDFDYDFSDSAAHHIQVLLIDTGSTTDDGVVYVDGALVARESEPNGTGDNWDNFDIVSINESGRYIFTGDTDGATSSDEFIAVDGEIVLREGATVGCVELVSSASLRAASMNNRAEVAHAWGISGGHEILFVGEADDLAASRRLLQRGDFVDTDGDEVPDAEVIDLNASTAVGPALSFADDGFIHAEVDLLLESGAEVEALLRIRVPRFDCIADLDGDDLVGFSDILAVLAVWGDCPGCLEDLDQDCAAAFGDILFILAEWGPCPE